MGKFIRNYRPMAKLWLGNHLHICIDNPDDIKTILNSPSSMDKTAAYDIINVVVGNGLFTISGEYYYKIFKYNLK